MVQGLYWWPFSKVPVNLCLIDLIQIAEWGASFDPFTFTDYGASELSTTVPSDIAAGQYLARIEQVGLHVPGSPQWYISCAQINVRFFHLKEWRLSLKLNVLFRSPEVDQLPLPRFPSLDMLLQTTPDSP
jgi:hypothetical protein